MELDYSDAAFVCIVFICEDCRATLDPDKDLGPDINSHSDGWPDLLAKEALRRGWLIDMENESGIAAYCPECAKKRRSAHKQQLG